jgi:hypothetical protein
MEAMKTPQFVELEPIPAFYAEMKSWIYTPPRGDPVYSAFCEAFLEANARLPKYREMTQKFIKEEPIGIPSYQLNKYFTAHQALLISDDDYLRESVGYPDLFILKEACTDWLIETFQDPASPAYSQLEEYLKMTYNKNEAQRAVVPAFIAGLQILSGVISDRPWHLQENGAAGNLNSVALAMDEKLLDPVTVVDEEGNPDTYKSGVFNAIVRRAHDSFGSGIGIELRPPMTEEDFIWMKSSTLDPLKLDRIDRNGKFEDRYDLLAATNHQNVEMVVGDLFGPGEAGEKKLREQQADVNFSSHVVEQNRRRMRELVPALEPRTRHTGVLAIQGYLRENHLSPNRPEVLQRWYRKDYTSSTLVSTMPNLAEGWYSILEWRNTACDTVRLVPEGLAKLAPDAVDLFGLKV